MAGISLLFAVAPVHAKEGEGKPGMNMPTPVTAATAQQQAMPVWLDAQGTVIPRNYVSVMPRVAGQLLSVDFEEGKPVKAGQLLATIDPRPYRIQVDQAQAQLVRDQAQLSGAQSDLERYETLLAQDSISSQQVVDQRATVAQLKGTVASDQAALDNAKLQLEWTRIVSPRSGIAGLRQVDRGNMVGTTGAIGGGTSALSGTASAAAPIVTIAQVQPISVTFAIAQNQLPKVLERMRGASLPVQAWDQRRANLLDSGKVIAVDNLINAATGTVMIKAQFANANMALFPNQFVNVRLLVDTIPTAIAVPTAAIAVGASGSYVYVIDAANKVAVRPVTTAVTHQDYTAISAGIKVGERVVTDGLDRLKDGGAVEIVAQYGVKSAPAAPHGKEGAAHPHKQDSNP
ncbi:MAG: efflux RND transporter periplasmic adaptor subunit [Gallionella sp.]